MQTFGKSDPESSKPLGRCCSMSTLSSPRQLKQCISSDIISFFFFEEMMCDRLPSGSFVTIPKWRRMTLLSPAHEKETRRESSPPVRSSQVALQPRGLLGNRFTRLLADDSGSPRIVANWKPGEIESARKPPRRDGEFAALDEWRRVRAPSPPSLRPCRSGRVEAHASDTSWVPQETPHVLAASAGGWTAVSPPWGVITLLKMCRCNGWGCWYVWGKKKKKKKERCNGFQAELSRVSEPNWMRCTEGALLWKKTNKGVFLCVGGSFFLFHFPAKRTTPARGRRGRFSSGRLPPPWDNAGCFSSEYAGIRLTSVMNAITGPPLWPTSWLSNYWRATALRCLFAELRSFWWITIYEKSSILVGGD